MFDYVERDSNLNRNGDSCDIIKILHSVKLLHFIDVCMINILKNLLVFIKKEYTFYKISMGYNNL